MSEEPPPSVLQLDHRTTRGTIACEAWHLRLYDRTKGPGVQSIDEFLFLKGQVAGYMQTCNELVELTR